MRVSRFGKLLAVASAALLLVNPAYSQTAPRPAPPPVVRAPPPVVRPPPNTAPTTISPRTQLPREALRALARRPPPPPPPARPIPPGTDADGDGFVDARVLRSTEPGAGNGNDCDDSNAAVYPGNFETADDRDSDCDPTTIGWLDMDQDGYVSDRISNPIPGTPYINQGLDCDDEEAGIHLGAQELPNRIDDDCDGAVDNLLGAWWTPR